MSDFRLQVLERLSRNVVSLTTLAELRGLIVEALDRALEPARTTVVEPEDLAEPLARRLWQERTPVSHGGDLAVPVLFGTDLLGAIVVDRPDLEEADRNMVRAVANLAASHEMLAKAFDEIRRLHGQDAGAASPD